MKGSKRQGFARQKRGWKKRQRGAARSPQAPGNGVRERGRCAWRCAVKAGCTSYSTLHAGVHSVTPAVCRCAAWSQKGATEVADTWAA